MDAGVEHYGFSFVLDDVAGATNLVAATEAEEVEEVGFILNWGDWLARVRGE